MSDACAVRHLVRSGTGNTSAGAPRAGEKHERAGRGSPSSRRFARALTAAPLRPARASRFARTVRGDLTGGCHAASSHTK